MPTIRFIHTGDLHFDAPFRNLKKAGLSTIRRKDIFKTFDRIIQHVKDVEAQFLIISGDLYEESYIRKQTIHYINNRFKEINSCRVILVPGNHDPLTPTSYYSKFDWADNVYLLNDSSNCLKFEDLSVCFYGIGFDTFHQNEVKTDDIIALKRFINILVMHGTLDMSFTDSPYNPVDSSTLQKLGMDYYALGHFHTNVINANNIKGICNAGSPEPLGFDEIGDHYILDVELEKEEGIIKRFDINKLSVQQKKYITLKSDMSGCVTQDEMKVEIFKEISDYDLDNTLFKIELTGYLEKGISPDIEELEGYINDKCCYAKLIDKTKLDINIEELMKDPGVKGEFTRAIMNDIKKAADDEKQLLQKALYLGLEALDG